MRMSYLDDLKKAVSDAFKDASDKETIDKMVSINSLIANVESENKALCDKNKELISAYKDAVLHPGISNEKDPEPTDVPPAVEAPSFDSFLAKAMNDGGKD